MRKETIRSESPKDRTSVILDYMLLLLKEDKRDIAERYKNKEHMTSDEVKLARKQVAEIRVRQSRLMRGT